MDSTGDLKSSLPGSKAETLERVAPLLTTARVLPQERFAAAEWQQDPDAIVARIAGRGWLPKSVIVRSSALAEDADGASLAGRFLSVAAVSDEAGLRDAVRRVIDSFGNREGADQVFVQPMLRDVAMSGVAFSIDPNNAAPYVVINYDDATGSTSSVTGGATNELRTFYCYRHGPPPADSALASVVALLRELERVLGRDALDVEFACDAGGQLYLLQVRPLLASAAAPKDDAAHRRAVDQIHAKVSSMMKPHPYLHGPRTVFGVMPDWNPAEIIGVRPRPLALSLYKDLVTDSIWAYQRDNYGYRNLRSFPLLVSLAGQPYIDVRVSFNSFIPADVETALAEKLASYYMDQLVLAPSNHDKVEFEIIFSCYTLDLPERLARLREHGFSAGEIASFTDSLRRLTNGIIHGERGLWRKDVEKIHELEARRAAIRESDLDRVAKIYWLLEDCKRYGTLPFAGLARAGFIAVQLLKSLVAVGILSSEELQHFMSSLETVSSRLTRDLGEMSREAFMDHYGHLRPGTYDILSLRYDEAPDLYFDWTQRPPSKTQELARFALSLEQLRRTEALLDEHGLDHDVLGLFGFIKGAIEGREYAKFVFTRSLSDILSEFKTLGAEQGLSVAQCSYAEIDCIKRLYASSAAAADVLAGAVDSGMAAYEITQRINLPPLITSPQDVLQFHLPGAEPNFITLGRVVAETVSDAADRRKLRGRIVLIPSADPGFDWIFAQGISGFVTMYGGVNSHMAIRAAELGVPAVIGAGEVYFRQWAKAARLELDCASRQVRVLK